MVDSLVFVSEISQFRGMTDKFFLVNQDTQESTTSLGEVEKIFPQRGSLCLRRLVKRANFICSRCSLEKTLKLVGYAKDEQDKPLCNDCYDYLLSTSEKQG